MAIDMMDVDETEDAKAQIGPDEPKLVLFDATIFKGRSTLGGVDDLSTGIPLRAEGRLWIEEPHKMRCAFSIYIACVEVSNCLQCTSQMAQNV